MSRRLWVVSQAWLAWVIARLGGWNCYYRQTGPKTMRADWARLETMIVGFHISSGIERRQKNTETGSQGVA